MDPTAIATLLGGVATVAGVLLTGWFGRRQSRAQADQITATAHSLIYSEYREIITELRTDAQVAREESRGAKSTAREAEQRADKAEEMAYKADSQMQAMERLLIDLRVFLETVPNTEVFVAQIDRYTRKRADAPN